MRKKRRYDRDTPFELVRDYKLFAIACEGSKTEPEYFKLFKHISPRIAIDIIDEVVSDEEADAISHERSAPKWVLNRAMRYIEKEGLNEDDQLWFVIDIDRWKTEQIREIAQYCDQHPNWNIVLSNPCFEVWLFFHKKPKILIDKKITCKELKFQISKHTKEGYNPLYYLSDLDKAMARAKLADSDKDYYFPKPNQTKVYLLCEALINAVGRNNFNEFLNVNLPNLKREFIKNKDLAKKGKAR